MPRQRACEHRTALVWLRRDLRLTDNPALHHAVANAAHVVPVFIHAPDEEAPWSPGAASRWWLHHSLAALNADLEKRGSKLVIRAGPTLAALRTLIDATGATLVTWNRLYEPAIVARDTGIKTALAEQVEVSSHNAALLFEPWTLRTKQQQPYKIFTAFWRLAESQLDLVPAPKPAPRRVAAPLYSPRSIALEQLDLLPGFRWDTGIAALWTPGEAGALRQLKRFRAASRGYVEGRDRPDRAGTSRLSPHLHFGEIGPRQLLAELRSPAAADAQTDAAYRRQLGWREFGHHLLYNFPSTADASLDARFERLRWTQDKKPLRAWQRGLSGYPMVDAGMRELWTTGWMHNRVRMVVASLLTKNLQTHWIEGARWFWDTLVDADLANCAGNSAGRTESVASSATKTRA